MNRGGGGGVTVQKEPINETKIDLKGFDKKNILFWKKKETL
jgi:hypothetical protein